MQAKKSRKCALSDVRSLATSGTRGFPREYEIEVMSTVLSACAKLLSFLNLFFELHHQSVRANYSNRTSPSFPDRFHKIFRR